MKKGGECILRRERYYAKSAYYARERTFLYLHPTPLHLESTFKSNLFLVKSGDGTYFAWVACTCIVEVVGQAKDKTMKYYKKSKVLSNGQVATVFWQQDEWAKSAMEVSAIIGKSISDNKKWYNGNRNFQAIKSTGNCGLEGLLFFLSVIRDLQKQYPCLTVEWLDDKRQRAYAYLKKVGFQDGHYCSHPDCKVYFWTRP